MGTFMPVIFAIGISLWGMHLWLTTPLELFLHRATLVRVDKERLTCLSKNRAPGLSQWTGDEDERIVRAVKTVSTKFNGDRGGHLMAGIWRGATSVEPHGSTTWRRKTRDGRICFLGCPAAKEVYEALALGGLCLVKALGIEGVGAHVLAWCSRNHQTYGEQDYCG